MLNLRRWRQHRRYPRVVERPQKRRVIRVHPNRERWRDREARIVAGIVRAQHRGELP